MDGLPGPLVIHPKRVWRISRVLQLTIHSQQAMTPPRQVIGDSDDDDDDAVILLRSPSGHGHIESTAGDSSSTDPSFFRGVYEEQQHKEILPPRDRSPEASDGAYRGAHGNDARPTIDGSIRGGGGPAADLWDVPSSPEVVAWHGTKRKRGGSQQPDDSSAIQAAGQRLQIVISAAGGAGSMTPTTTKKHRGADQDRQQEQENAVDGDSFSSIGPTDPRGLAQPPYLGSASSAAQHRLPVIVDDKQGPVGNYGDYERVFPPSAAVTESTIAYPTPSRYAILGPQHAGGDGDATAHDSPHATPTRPRAGLSPSELVRTSFPLLQVDLWRAC